MIQNPEHLSHLKYFFLSFLQYKIYLNIFRTILAALHFNYNLHRENKKDLEGKTKVKVNYPKFKKGEATVRDLKEKQNFGVSPMIFTCVTVSC